MKRKRNIDPDSKPRFCDPGACSQCEDIGDGNFVCTKHHALVVAGWENTADYGICKKRRNHSNRGAKMDA